MRHAAVRKSVVGIGAGWPHATARQWLPPMWLSLTPFVSAVGRTGPCTVSAPASLSLRGPLNPYG